MFKIESVIRPLDTEHYALQLTTHVVGKSQVVATPQTEEDKQEESDVIKNKITPDTVIVQAQDEEAHDDGESKKSAKTIEDGDVAKKTAADASTPVAPTSEIGNSKDLVIVLDVSGSMYGALDQSKEAICTLLTFLSENGGEGTNVTFIIFSDNAITYPLGGLPLSQQVAKVRSVNVIGGTDFASAFHAIGDVEYRSSSAAIVFFTDGQDGSGVQVREQKKQNMISQLKSKVGAFEFHTIGFTSYHDVHLLTDITKQGTAQGTFQYVKNSEDIPVAIGNLSPLVLGSALIGNITIVDKKQNKNISHQKLSLQGDNSGEIFDSKCFFKVDSSVDMTDLEFVVEISANDSVFISSLQPKVIKLEEMSDIEKSCIQIEYIECQLLGLTQEIAESKSDKSALRQTKNKLRLLEERLDTIRESKFGSRMARKRILTQCVEVSEVVNQINSLLAEAMVSELSNDKLATLNSLGYKAITKSGLQKKMDLRAQENVDLFEKLEENIAQTVKKFNFDHLKEKYGTDAEELGKCLISCNNWIEALQDEDCLCLTLDVSRSEAAIADPTQVKIKSINQSFMTAESFLESVMFSLGNSQDHTAVHGGFDKSSDAHVVTGVARESITAVLPLFINQHHWRVAKHKMKSVMGFVCTLNVLGYTYGQVKIVPFLVLAEACKSVDTDFEKKQFELIKETCKQIYRDSSTPNVEFKMSEIVKQQFENYITDPASRTVDVIASNAVFLAQLLCAVELGDIQVDSVDLDRFFQYLAEEELRRLSHKDTDLTATQVMSLLNIDQAEFIDKFISDFKEKFNAQNSDKESSGSQYASTMIAMLRNAGADTSDLEIDQQVSADVNGSDQSNQSDNSDIKIVAPIQGYDGSMAQLSSDATQLIDKYDTMMKRKVSTLLNMRRFISKTPYVAYTDLASIGISSNESRLCLAMQNKQQAKNQSRKQAFESGSYVDPFSNPKSFLEKTYVKVITDARQAQVTHFLAVISQNRATQLAMDFASAKTVVEAAGALLGVKLGAIEFSTILTTLQSQEWPLAVEKVILLRDCQFRGVQLIIDRPEGWRPAKRNVYRLWKANRKQFPDIDTFERAFGFEFRNYYNTRMYFLEKGIV